MKRRFLELVHITWWDIEVTGEWDELSEPLKAFEKIQSIGFLVAQDLDMYVIAADYDHELKTFNRVMRIPRGCVHRLRTVTIIPLRTESRAGS